MLLARRSMRAVVVDEADQLLTGGYERDCLRVLDALREGDRLRKAGAVCAQLRISPEHFQELPRHFRRAAYEGTPLSCCDHSVPSTVVQAVSSGAFIFHSLGSPH